ncbi:MAG TPA: efflux transporter outer membrane subunit [Flavisolibacter sp.]|nr:efflux transporter outer membrane subunit [Flavisolibacter sp.]
MKRNIYHFSFFIALLVLINACSVHKKYEQPQLDVPATYRGVSYSDTSTIADIEWRRFYTDTDLQKLIETGLDNNHDLLVAIKRMEMSTKRVQQSKLLNLPDLNLQITGQYNRPSNNSLNGISVKNFLGKSHVENYMAVGNLSWEVDVWGKIKGQKELALARYLQSQEGIKAVQTSLVAQIAQGYYNLLMLDKQLEIARSNLALNDSFLVATRLLKDAGISNALAVQQAEVQKRSTELLIPQLEEAIELQENSIQVLTGQMPGPVKRNSKLDELNLFTGIEAGTPVAIVSRRPDVRTAELDLIAANAEAGIAKANLYPALNLTLGGGLESFRASNWFNLPNSLFGLVAGTIAQPVFQRGRLKTEADLALLQREEAVIRFRQSVLQATTEVTDALLQLRKLKEQEAIAAAQTDTLHKAIETAQLLFRSDMATYLEIITVQGNALQAELELAAIRRNQLTSKVELYRALGGGWK